MAPSLEWTIIGAWPTKPTGPAGPTGSTAAGRASDAGRRHSTVASTTTEPALAELSEGALIEACLAGRSAAFDLVVERHRRSVYQLCWRFDGNHEDASDL